MKKEFIDKSQWLKLTQIQRQALKDLFGIKVVGGIIVVDDKIVDDGVNQAMLADTFNVETMEKFTGKKGTCDELWEVLLEKVFNPVSTTAQEEVVVVSPATPEYVPPANAASTEVKKTKKTQNVRKPKGKKRVA